MSQDNPEERKNARDMVLHVIIGLIIILIALSLVAVIFNSEEVCTAGGGIVTIYPTKLLFNVVNYVGGGI